MGESAGQSLKMLRLPLLHLPVMVPDAEVATPLRLWASQEKVLVVFKPTRQNEMTRMCEDGTPGVF